MLEKRQRLIAMARRWGKNAGKTPQVSVFKKPIDLQALLKWAYFDELPKAEIRRAKPLREFRERWASIEDFGDYIASSGGSSCNLWGRIQRFDRWGEPHEDALLVAKAVKNLDVQICDLPDNWNPFSDIPDSGSYLEPAKAQVISRLKLKTRNGKQKLRFKPSALVFNYSILGGCPAWELQKTSAAEFKDIPKSQAIVTGLNRAEYEIWRMSLEFLANSLPAQLVKHELLPSLPPVRPWEAAADKKKRILPVLIGPLSI